MKVFASVVLAASVSAVLIESTVNIQDEILLAWANTDNFSALGLNAATLAKCYTAVSDHNTGISGALDGVNLDMCDADMIKLSPDGPRELNPANLDVMSAQLARECYLLQRSV